MRVLKTRKRISIAMATSGSDLGFHFLFDRGFFYLTLISLLVLLGKYISF